MQTDTLNLAKLKAARKRLKVSEAELALESMCNPEIIEKLEDGYLAQISRLVLDRILDTLGLTFEQVTL